jgi:hypothetical protein
MTQREFDEMMFMLTLYMQQMNQYERNTHLSNYDKFKQWLCEGLGIAKSAVQSAWDWFKGLFS